MTSNITELCQNFGIGLLLMYLETVSIKETPYLIIFSHSFYLKEMEIIGKSKFISKSPWSRVKAKQGQARLFKWPRAWQIKNIYQSIKEKKARLTLRFWIFLGQLNFSISYHIFGHKEVKSLVGKKVHSIAIHTQMVSCRRDIAKCQKQRRLNSASVYMTLNFISEVVLKVRWQDKVAR